jgi:hypothetical protein
MQKSGDAASGLVSGGPRCHGFYIRCHFTVNLLARGRSRE